MSDLGPGYAAHEDVEILTEPHCPAWQPGRTVAEFRDSEGNRMVIGSR